MSKRAYKTYTREFKREAVRLAEESDLPATQIARQLGIHRNMLADGANNLPIKGIRHSLVAQRSLPKRKRLRDYGRK